MSSHIDIGLIHDFNGYLYLKSKDIKNNILNEKASFSTSDLS